MSQPPQISIATRSATPETHLPSIEQAIAKAAHRTAVDFDFLLAQARVESSLDPNAHAPTSSATGLYQFIESTWLETMKRHGKRFGLEAMSQAIGTTGSGTAFVADPAQREAILSLRSDPEIASLMAASLAEDNRSALMPILGRQPSHGELYLAHFLGARGAGQFLSAMRQDPNQSAYSLFQRAASTNRSIFFQPSGKPRSLGEVRDLLDAKITNAQQHKSGSIASSQPRLNFANQAGLPPAKPSHQPLRDRSTISGVPNTMNAQPRSPMSSLLRSAFGAGSGADLGSVQINRAYNQLKAFGL